MSGWVCVSLGSTQQEQCFKTTFWPQGNSKQMIPLKAQHYEYASSVDSTIEKVKPLKTLFMANDCLFQDGDASFILFGLKV